MAEIAHVELLAALERRDAPTRALIDLSLRAGYSDADVAGFLGLREMAVAHWRMNALNELAAEVGVTGPTAGTDIALYLLDLPAEAWKRALPRVLDDGKPKTRPAQRRGGWPDEPREERQREPMPVWVRPMPRPRLRDRIAQRVPALRLPVDDLVLMAAAAGAALTAGLLATTVSAPALLSVIGAIVLTAILIGRPQVGALALIVLVALFPRSALFEQGLPLAGGSLKVTDALVGATLAAWLMQAAVRPDRQRMPGRTLTIAVLAFLGIAIFSISTATALGTPMKLSLLELRPLLTLLLIFPIVAGVRDIRHLKLGVGIVLAASVITSLNTIWSYVIGEGEGAMFTDGGTRVVNTSFQYPMAGTLWALVFFIFVKSPKLRWALLGAATINLTAVFFTQQRGAWIALILSLALLFVLSPDSRRRRLAVASGALLAAAAVMLVAINAHSASRSQNIIDAGVQRFLSSGSYDRDVSAGHRLNEWRAARFEIEERPLTGIGMGSSITFWSPMYSDTRKAYGGSATEYYIHNSYVWFALKLGLPGLIAFLFLLTTVFAAAIRGYRRTRDPDVRMILTGSMTTLVAMMVLSTIGPHLNVDNSTPLLAGTIAMIAVAPRLAREPATETVVVRDLPALRQLQPRLG